MSFRDIMKSDIKNVLHNPNEFGGTVTYDPGGLESKVIGATIIPEQSYQDEDASGAKILVHRASVLISIDPTDGIASPSQTKTINFDGKTWAIDTLQSDRISAAQLGVVRTERLATGIVGV